MSAKTFDELRRHVGHRLTCVLYGNPPQNVAAECETCGEVILDYEAHLCPVCSGNNIEGCSYCDTEGSTTTV